MTIPLGDPRIEEFIVDWTDEERQAAWMDLQLYGNLAVTDTGKYVPWMDQPKEKP